MFKNPGSKIKNLAQIFFWVQIVVAVFGIFALADSLFENILGIVLVVVILLVVFILAYLSTLLLVAFGELVESNTAIRESNEYILETNEQILDMLNNLAEN